MRSGKVPISIRLSQNFVDLTHKDYCHLTLKIPPGSLDRSYLLIVDIYSYHKPIHPEGHIGWWATSVGPLDSKIEVIVSSTGSRMNVHFGRGKSVQDKWQNAELSLEDFDLLRMHIVLRSIPSNTIVFEDIICIFLSLNALNTYKEKVDSILQIYIPKEQLYPCWFIHPRESRIFIVSNNINFHDAIGEFCRQMALFLRECGFETFLCARNFDPIYRGAIMPTYDLFWEAREKDLIIFNYSTFDPLLPYISGLNIKKVGYYHNITPGNFFRPFDAEYSRLLEWAREEIKWLSNFDALVANSHFSANDLTRELNTKVKLKYSTMSEKRKETCLSPYVDIMRPVLGLNKWDSILSVEPPIPFDRYLLFVGRIAPHKRIEDLLALLDAIAKYDDSLSLVIVGKDLIPSYTSYLKYLINETYSNIQKRVLFAGSYTNEQLKYAYENCSAFITMSEHEGFCIPVAEAMHFRKPIFAYAQEGIKECLGRAGLIFYEKDFDMIANTILTVLLKNDLRERIVAIESKRYIRLTEECSGEKLLNILERVFFTK